MGHNHKFYTVQQLSEMLGLHPQTVRGYIKKGEMKAFLLGRDYRVSKDALGRFLERRKIRIEKGGGRTTMSQRGKYRANRGGHAPGHLREAFLEYLDMEEDANTVEVDGDRRPLRWLIGQLWSCTDILPSSYCDLLDLSSGSTYAQAVRKVAEERP